MAGNPQDVTDIMEAAKAIALLKQQNKDKPLPNAAAMQRFLDKEQHRIACSFGQNVSFVPSYFRVISQTERRLKFQRCDSRVRVVSHFIPFGPF